MSEAREDERLYGTVGAEHLQTDAATVYETDIEPWHEPSPDLRIEIEEFDVHPARYHLPDADRLLEWVDEWACDMGDVDEFFGDRLRAVVAVDEVKQAAEALLDAVAAHMTYRMAKNHLRSLWVTWDEHGEPLLDGEPMYVKSANAGGES